MTSEKVKNLLEREEMKDFKDIHFYLTFNEKVKATKLETKDDIKYSKLIQALQNQIIFKLLDIILLNPKIDIINLARKSDMDTKDVKDIVYRLENLNLISERKIGKVKVYSGNFKKIEPVLKILKVKDAKINEYKRYNK